ncbi:MAG: nuclear transport factor 2 family protein [Actinomycetota bacterium]
MSELDDFLSTTLPRQIDAERTLHNGNAEPRLEMWSRNDPVTVLGALGVQWSGWQEVSEGFRWLASRFSNCQMYEFELLAAGASGDFAYMVGYEHYEASRDGGPVTPNRIRATHVCRRENGEWKIVHRHGDGLSSDHRPPAVAPTG